MVMDKKLKILILIVVALGALAQMLNYNAAKKRQQQVYETQWMDEYGVAVPEGKTVEECLTNPEICLNR